MRRVLVTAVLVAIVGGVTAGTSSAKTTSNQQAGKAVATTLTFACALDKNGSLRWPNGPSVCRKKETGVTVPTTQASTINVCVQADGSSRKVGDPTSTTCPAPGVVVTLPPLNVSEYFCAVAADDNRLKHVSGAGQCGGDTELIVAATNHAPTDIGLSPQAVDENLAVGTVVGDLTSTDPDGGDTHTYTFTGGNPDNAAFTIDNSVTPRKLKTAAMFNFEAKSSYSIMIRTTDAGGLTFDKAFTINVNDVNEAPVADDETFNGVSGAVGNTTLVGNDPDDGAPATPDPTDTSPVTDRPHKTISADILNGDTDPEGTALTVTPGTFATNDGGSVTLEADGDFTFEPAASTSCTDTSDFFDYTVSDGTLTDIGRVTIAISGCVRYVNNDDAEGNSGTSEKPFDTLAQAESASATGDSIFVYDGNDTTSGYTAGINLKANQSLIGEAATLTVGSDTLHSADAANKPTITDNNADVVDLDDNNTVKAFNIDPQGTGGGIAGTAGDTGGGTIDDVQIVDTGTKGTQPGLELNGTTGTFNISNLTVNNGDGSSATSTDEGVLLNNAGTVNFASTGTISITTSGARGLDAISTNMGAGSVFDDITVTNSGSGGVLLSSTTGSSTTFGDGSGTDLDLTTVSGAQPAFSIQTSGSVSVPAGGTANLSATGGPAADIVSPAASSSFPFDAVSSTNSANDGVNLDTLGTAIFSASSGTIGGESGIGFDLAGGSGAITYPGTFNNGSGALVAEVTGRTGGVVSLSGNMNDTNDAGGGVNIASNTGGSTVFSGATKQYNTGASDAVTFSNSDGHTFVLSGGGTDIDTTSGNGLNATTSGTLQITPLAGGNTIDSTALGAGNRGLNISDTDIASADVSFDHINTSGGANGIRLNNTGNSAGDFNLSGTGGTCTTAAAAGCTGGAIQNSTGAGVELTSVPGAVNLTRVSVNGGGDDGIRATTVGSSAGNGIALANSFVGSNGNANTENGLDWTNVNGTSSVTSDTFSSNFDFNAQLVNNTSGTLNLTVTSSTFNSAGVDDGLQIISNGNSTMNSTIGGVGVGNTFTANKGDGIDYGSSTASPNATSNTTISNNTVTGSGTTTTDGGIVWTPDGHAKVHINNNNIQSVSATALSVQSNGAGVAGATTDATVNNNVIGTNGQVNSGSDDGDGIQVLSPGDGTSKFLIKDNAIHGFDKNGMKLRGSESTNGADTDITAQGNTIDSPDTTHAETAILLQAGSLSADVVDVCADVGGAGALANTFSGALNFGGPGIGNFWLSLRFVNSKMKAPGYVGTTFTDRQNYFLGRNTGFGGGAAPYVEDGAQNLTTPSPANCLQPTLPSTG